MKEQAQYQRHWVVAMGSPLTGPSPIETVLSRFILLNDLPDGAVARWLLDSLPDPDPLWGFGVPDFMGPRLRLSQETMSSAVDACSSRNSAEFLGVLFQAGSSGRAAKRLGVLCRTGLPARGRGARDAVLRATARGWAGTAPPDLDAVWPEQSYRMKCKWGDLETANSTIAYGEKPLHLMWLSKLLWSRLGDDPSAWALACELLEEDRLQVSEVIATTLATLPVAPECSKGPGRDWMWRWRKHVEFEYQGEPLVGVHQ